jgi:AraC family transcriptional regulator, regulatory protein of adaptative response / methylated-DNA-[protein]-cysteine methyltransferase
MTDYERIEKVINFLSTNFKEQPNLEELSKIAGISQYHFQRMFKEWAGVSPKKFLQYISLEHSKKLLNARSSISETSFETGLSGSSRLHDLFITIEGMTPGEYKSGGKALSIYWGKYNSPYGEINIASTSKGICHLAFTDMGDSGFEELRKKYPNATFYKEKHILHSSALSIFTNDPTDLMQIKLHLKGTSFQLKVWEALLKIPSGNLITYAGLSKSIGSTNSARAVGTAVGGNPVAYLIPCHRVIRSTGIIGEYHWGSVRKTAIIGREASQLYGEF